MKDIVQPLALVLVASCCTTGFALAADIAPKDQQRPQAQITAPPGNRQAQAPAARPTDRPPAESGRPAIGPRTTQALAADAIAHSDGR